MYLQGPVAMTTMAESQLCPDFPFRVTVCCHVLHRTHWRKYGSGDHQGAESGERAPCGERRALRGTGLVYWTGITVNSSSRGTLDSHAWPPNLHFCLACASWSHNDEAHHSHPHHQSTSQTAKLSSPSMSRELCRLPLPTCTCNSQES